MAEAAMAESSNLVMKARDLLASPSHEGLAIVVDQFFMRPDSDEYQTVHALFDFCVANFANCLTLKLLQVYRCSSDDVIRFRSILLLAETLTKFRNHSFDLSIFALRYIKPLLISCLTMREATKSDAKILRIIVSLVSSNVVMLDDGGWEELGDCILSLAKSDPLRAFNVFLDLPPVYGEFMNRFSHKLLEEVYKILRHPEEDRDEDWTLALETAIKLGIQLLDLEILGIVLNSADELVRNGKEQFLLGGLRHLEKFLAKEANLCKWSSDRCSFVSEFAFKIAKIGTQTKDTARKIYQMVTKLDNYVDNPSFKLSPSHVKNQENGLESDRDLYNIAKEYPPIDLLNTFMLTDVAIRFRDTAIRRLQHLLCDHTSGKRELDVSEIQQLKPILIGCLRKEGTPENMFRILGQVVYHVALETFNFEKDPWFDLWDYIASESKAEFKKAVYVFQCLTMQLVDKDFFIPAINNLLEGIYRTIPPPRELLVDNSDWVLAFTGAFCVVIHLLKMTSHAGYVKEIAYKIIDSVRELVERGMEIGLVRRAFRDLENIVEQQWYWYDFCEYRFVKGLLWRLYAVKGMKMESRIVLWRINVILERTLDQRIKVLPETELDWLNQPET